MEAARRIFDLGWRQGSILLPTSLPGGASLDPPLPEFGDDSILVVLTQDCDLVQDDFEKEPFAEVLLMERVTGSANGNLLFGKNPRRIQIALADTLYEASCHHRARFDRRILSVTPPCEDITLSPDHVRLLRDWIAKRYLRPAFPNSLNERFNARPHGEARDKLLKSYGHHFVRMFLACSPRHKELPPDLPYRVSLWLVITREGFENIDVRSAAVQAVGKIESVLSQVPGIKLLSCEVRHEGQITLDDLRLFSEWDFDYLTHREALQPS